MQSATQIDWSKRKSWRSSHLSSLTCKNVELSRNANNAISGQQIGYYDLGEWSQTHFPKQNKRLVPCAIRQPRTHEWDVQGNVGTLANALYYKYEGPPSLLVQGQDQTPARPRPTLKLLSHAELHAMIHQVAQEKTERVYKSPFKHISNWLSSLHTTAWKPHRSTQWNGF